ncbi:ATP-binding protein [Rubrivirga sp.]|uniref:ATP-binding protein n=1 Tax=Rubrivirga sp. TaxID=1885344 RepID=UPI003B51F837
MNDSQLHHLLSSLAELPHETEWAEFKVNNYKPEEIGEYLSALSNSALLHGRPHGYLVFGVDDKTHEVRGTEFRPSEMKVGNEDLEPWLARLLDPRIDFRIHSVPTTLGDTVVLFEVGAAGRRPVKFKGVDYVRVGSYKKKLKDYPEKERKIWLGTTPLAFEAELAAEDLDADAVLRLLDYPAVFESFGLPLPPGKLGVLNQLETERLIYKEGESYSITNAGALLFARWLPEFPALEPKAVRLIFYKGKGKLETEREITGKKGYVVGFEGLIDYLTDRLPANEVLGKALREEVKMYPDVAVRELVANALVHQDLTQKGTSPMVEVYEDRIEVTNNGLPLIKPLRFLDEVPRSRNEVLAGIMKKARICEERGSGIDKVVHWSEVYQLPAPSFEEKRDHTVATLYSYRPLNEMTKDERVRACYQHAGLRQVHNERMTNSSLRDRFKISDANYSKASRIIAETVEAGLVKPYDPENRSNRTKSYVPFWAPGVGDAGPV